MDMSSIQSELNVESKIDAAKTKDQETEEKLFEIEDCETNNTLIDTEGNEAVKIKERKADINFTTDEPNGLGSLESPVTQSTGYNLREISRSYGHQLNHVMDESTGTKLNDNVSTVQFTQVCVQGVGETACDTSK